MKNFGSRALSAFVPVNFHTGMARKINAGAADAKQRWLTRGVVGIGLASLFADWGHEIATALLPLLLAGFGAPAFALGVIEGVADGLSSFAKLAGGWIADRPAWRKPVAVLGYLVTGLGTAAFGLATAWPQVLVARAISWTGRGVRGPSRDVLLADSVAPSQTGRAFGFERTMDTVGAILGPLCAMWLLVHAGMRSAMYWTVVPGALAALSFAILVPSPRQIASHVAKPFWTSLATLPPEFRKFLISVALFGLGDFAHSMLILRVVQLLAPGHGALRAGAIGLTLYTLHNVTYAGASYPAGALADRVSARFGRRGILAVGYLLAAATCAGFIALPQTNPRISALVGLLCLAGLYVAIQDTLEKAVAADLLPRDSRAMGYGVLATVNGIGDFVSSMAVGVLWSKVSPDAGFAYAGVLTALGGILLFVTSSARRAKRTH
jgi:MFS family permease